jgi:hypothetical protein
MTHPSLLLAIAIDAPFGAGMRVSAIVGRGGAGIDRVGTS